MKSVQTCGVTNTTSNRHEAQVCDTPAKVHRSRELITTCQVLPPPTSIPPYAGFLFFSPSAVRLLIYSIFHLPRLNETRSPTASQSGDIITYTLRQHAHRRNTLEKLSLKKLAQTSRTAKGNEARNTVSVGRMPQKHTSSNRTMADRWHRAR